MKCELSHMCKSHSRLSLNAYKTCESHNMLQMIDNTLKNLAMPIAMLDTLK